MSFLLAFFLPLFFALLATPTAMRVTRLYGVLDHPDDRKRHPRPTPRAGGMVLFPLTVFALVLSYPRDPRLPSLVMALTLIFAVGLWDDWRGAHYSTKFFAQTTAALFLVLAGIKIEVARISFLEGNALLNNDLVNAGLTVLWIVAITNALNLIDGVDGLAGGLAINALAGIALVSLLGGKSSLTLFCLMLAGGCLGFLRFNLHPAEAFLGDSGSLLLGFTIGTTALVQSAKTVTFLVLAVPVLFIAIPMLDTALAFLRRVSRGGHPFHADREHLHHKLLDLSFTPRQTLAYFLAFSSLMGLAALLLAQRRSLIFIVFGLLLAAGMLGMVKLLQVVNFHGFIARFNRRMKLLDFQADAGEFKGKRTFTVRMIFLLLIAHNILAAWPLAPGWRGVSLLATSFLALLVLPHLLKMRKEPRKVVYPFIYLGLIGLSATGQTSLLLGKGGGFSPAGAWAEAGLCLLGGGAAAAVAWRRRWEFFLVDPLQILASNLLVLVMVAFQHLVGGSPLAFFAVAGNSFILFFLFSVLLRKVVWKSNPGNALAGLAALLLADLAWLL